MKSSQPIMCQKCSRSKRNRSRGRMALPAVARAPGVGGQGAVWGWGHGGRASRPNTYEDSLCQETNCSCERIFLIFFRVPGPGAVDSRSRVLTCFLCTGANQAWRHQTRMEVPSSPGGRLQRAMGGMLCDLERMLCPRTGLLKGVAEPVRLASSCQTRERGSPRHLCDYRRLCRSQSGCPINGPRLWDKKPMRT